MWAGLDLAAKPQNPSALAIGDSWEGVAVYTVYTDEEILTWLESVGQVWIDAPLTAGEGPFRACDRELHRRGVSILPLTWPAMRRLHQRALRLYQRAAKTFYETFPWSLYGHLSHPRAARKRVRKDPEVLATWAKAHGLQAEPKSVHEWDAVACWAIGWLAQQGQVQALTGADGTLWVPA